MNHGLVKAAITIGGAVAIGAITGPLITISSPLWGLLGTHVSVNMLSLAGATTVTGLGLTLGKKSGLSIDSALEEAIIKAEIMAQKKKLASLEDHLNEIHQPQHTA